MIDGNEEVVDCVGKRRREKKGGGGGGARPLSVVEKEFSKYFPRIKSFTTYDL